MAVATAPGNYGDRALIEGEALFLASRTPRPLGRFQRNAGRQSNAVSRTNDAYAWTRHYAVSRPYTTNGLNQYTGTGGPAFSYDANGNLSTDGGAGSYYYDIENRLISAPGS